MELKKLMELLLHAANSSTRQSGVDASLPGNLLTKSAAYRRYGRSNVDRWLKEGLLKTSRKKIYQNMLEAVSASSNRHSYLPSAERN